jgi:amino acid transporter
MGWNYAMNWLVVLPFELTTAGITIAFCLFVYFP